jgi:CTP:molybdopterin cytidylyltransferase MocA
LILAAGESKRMGSPKALLEFQGETFLDCLTATFSQFCDPVVVVLGCGSGEIRAGLKHPERALIARNADYHLGQLSSMQCGLRALPPDGVEGVLFTLVDHPNVQPSTLAALLAHTSHARPADVARVGTGVETSNRQRGRCHGGQKVAVRRKWNQQFANDFLESLDTAGTSARATSLAIPRYQGRRGHPIYFNSSLIAEFLALPPDSQAKAVVARYADSIRFIDVADAGILDDVDDPAAYRRLIETA